MARERQKRRAEIVEGAGMARVDLQGCLVGGDGLLEALKVLQKVAAIDQGLKKIGIEADRLVEEFEPARAMAEIA
jgi:hypothetical protein